MKTKNLVRAITAAVALTFSLTGCSPVPGAGENFAALDQITKNPMPGFTLLSSHRGDSFCFLASYCSGNASATFTGSKKYDSNAAFCKDFIPWALKVGVQSWDYDPDYIAFPIKGHEGAAQFACVGANNFSLIGSTNGVIWMMNGGREQITVTTAMSNEGGIDDNRMVLRTWDKALAQIFPGNKMNMELLSAIETYRLANPKADPTSVKTIETAIQGIKLPSGSKIVKDSKGKAHYIYIPADAELLERCINIKPFNPDYFRMDNPGSGFVTLPIFDEGPVIDEFAYMTSKCPTP
jgi:hypothetical protein